VPSNLKKEYVKFSYPSAINRITKIENKYFQTDYGSLESSLYGTA